MAPHPHRPLLTAAVTDQILEARRAGAHSVECSLDLARSTTRIDLAAAAFAWQGCRFPYPQGIKERTVYFWNGSAFEAAARYADSLVKLVPTEWGAPTFEIDGIKMLPTSRISPWTDAQNKVELIRPRGKTILDTCGGLGYFAAWCVRGRAAHVHSYEINSDVIWLRDINPWSPDAPANLTLVHADVLEAIAAWQAGSFDAILHDPPRIGIAGMLYSQDFYGELARVLRRGGLLFHYTGAPNRLTTGRNVPAEVAQRLQKAGLRVQKVGDGLIAVKVRHAVAGPADRRPPPR